MTPLSEDETLERGMKNHYVRKQVLEVETFPRHFIVCYKILLVLS
jgi:hypothetical protein